MGGECERARALTCVCVCVYKRIVCKGRKCENEFFLGNFLTGLRRHAHIRVVSRARATAKRRIYSVREMVGGCLCVSGDGKKWLRVKGKSKKKPNSSGPDERSLRRLYILIYIYMYIRGECARILPLHYTYQISFRTCTIANSRSLALARTARRRLFEEGSRFNFSVTEPRLNYS